MKKLILVGSIIAVVIIVFASFTSVASAQATESNEGRASIFQRMRDKIADVNWEPGFLLWVLYTIFSILWSQWLRFRPH